MCLCTGVDKLNTVFSTSRIETKHLNAGLMAVCDAFDEPTC